MMKTHVLSNRSVGVEAEWVRVPLRRRICPSRVTIVTDSHVAALPYALYCHSALGGEGGDATQTVLPLAVDFVTKEWMFSVEPLEALPLPALSMKTQKVLGILG